MDVKLYIRWYLARMENIKVKISKHKGCPWETGLSNFWYEKSQASWVGLSWVTELVQGWEGGGERGQIEREYNEQLYSYGVMVCLSYLWIFFF